MLLSDNTIKRDKIIILADYLPDSMNSVGDILHALLSMISNNKDVVLIHHNDDLANGTIICNYGNIRVYSGMNKSKNRKNDSNRFIVNRLKLLNEIKDRFLKKTGLNGKNSNCKICKTIKRILKREKPDAVLFFIYSPSLDYVKICERLSIPYIVVLYDTYITRPYINIDEAYKIERRVIEQSHGYFVPSFFYSDYYLYYNKSFFSYDLPLVVNKELVIAAYSDNKLIYNYLYLGQIQSFRNAEIIQTIFKKIGIRLDIFTNSSVQSSETFIVHPAISGDELYRVISNSKYLVAFDNSKPYNHYLPSKVYLYVSFTKPVIAFGDNKESALIEFFKDYPLFYYQNIYEPLDGLLDFLKTNYKYTFDLDIYNKYTKFTKEKALKPLVNTIYSLFNERRGD